MADEDAEERAVPVLRFRRPMQTESDVRQRL
jgi:hypothetical protein